MEILNNKLLLLRLEEIRKQYLTESKNYDFLEKHFATIGKISNWCYSTGPIYDKPPYSLEMAGFDGGKLLKKKYNSPYEARIKGMYGSGFHGEKHLITIYPSKPSTMPLQANFYDYEDDKVIIHTISSQKAIDPSSQKPPKLIGLGELFSIEKNIDAYVGVGKGDAYAIKVFYADDEKMIKKVSMITAPSNYQNDFYLLYDENGDLLSVNCNGIIWSKK